MKRALLSQIRMDWRENTWLVIELLIVALVIWWFSLTLLREYKDSRIAMGADISDVYAANMSILNDEGDKIDNIPSDVAEHYVSEMQAMIDRIREMPMVEAASFGRNALPYNYNLMNEGVEFIDGRDTVRLHVNARIMSPDAAKVLRLESPSEKNYDKILKAFENNQIVLGIPPVTHEQNPNYGYDWNRAVGKELLNINPTNKIGAIANTIRRNEYEVYFNNGNIMYPVVENTPEILSCDMLMVRIKPDTDKEFLSAMYSEPAFADPSGVALSNLRPVEVDRKRVVWDTEVKDRAYIAGIIFLLAIVFIGLLGTFWYRVHLRTPEIAIRKTFGATDMDILRRFISEAMLLLLAALLLATGLCIGLMDYLKEGVLQYVAAFTSWKRDIALAGLISAAVMALMIIIGVGIPGLRAMRIEPAVALKEE